MMKRLILLWLIFPSVFFAQPNGPVREEVAVFFDFDKYFLNDQAVSILEQAITAKENVLITKIYGYCDSKGSNHYNDTLSLKRVNEVYRFLLNKGIKIREDYESKGFGEDFEQSEIQAENRRVLVMYEIAQPEKKTDYTKALAELVKTAKVGDKIKLKNINFRNNSAVIVPKSKPVLYDLLCIMEENPTLKIEIQGHICCQLESDQNDVSTSRARAIYMFLVRNKIDRKRLKYKGFGVSQPIHKIPERNEAEADDNRRVEIMIVEK